MIPSVRFSYDIFQQQRVGGVSRYFVELGLALRGIGIDVRPLNIVHVNEHLREGLRLPTQGRRAPQRALAIVNQASERLSRRSRHEVYHMTNLVVRDVPSPAVVTVYDLVREHEPSGFIDVETHRAAVAFWLQKAHAIIAISETTRRDIVRFHPRVSDDRISVIWPGVPLLSEPLSERTHPSPFLLYVGARSRYKDFDLLLRSFAASSARREVDLVCVGSSPFTESERAVIQSLKLTDAVVHRQGDDRQLAAAYRDAVALVYPSRYEGFGLPVVEAMHAGLPVVCSRGGALPEVTGGNALEFEVGDEGGLSEMLDTVVYDRTAHTRLSQLGRARASRFSWSASAVRTAEVYRSVLS